MLIAIDAGNSHIRLGGYEGDEQVFAASIASEPRQTADYYACMLGQTFALHGVNANQVSDVVIGSVVPSLTTVLDRAMQLLHPCAVLSVSSGVKTGLNIQSAEPRSIGADRIAEAVAAKARGTLPCVVVDLGTATTFTVLDAAGTLVGSSIAAGVRLSLKALRQSAAQLPAVAIEPPQTEALPRTTIDAMKHGALVGAACMIDGMVARFAETLGQMPVVYLTGGGAAAVSPYLHEKAEHLPSLGLDGLRLIWQKTRG